jgi:hypothetical protein
MAPLERSSLWAAVTLTVTDWVAAGLVLPEHVSVNVTVDVSGPLESLPEVGLEPDHEPDAEQLVALVELQVSVIGVPESTVAWLAVKVSVGASGGGGCAGFTVMVTDFAVPLQVSV